MEFTQSVRDPIHNWISFTEREKRVIDSPLVQRLKYVGQLTGIYQVFPGGVHNRFIHSLGAMHIAGKYASHLSQYLVGPDLGSDQVKAFIQIARMAGLLHDIGHGPYSHAYDRSIYQHVYEIDDGGHDQHRLKMIESEQLSPLIRQLGITPTDLIHVWTQKASRRWSEDDKITGKNQLTSSSSDLTNQYTLKNRSLYAIISHIIQGPIGADRIDFTLRDSYFTGMQHFGTIASSRIIHSSLLHVTYSQTDKAHYSLCYQEKAFSDIEQALDGRFYMYKGVYLHKTCSGVEMLISRMMEACREDLNLVARTEDLDEFVDLHDYSLVGQILTLDKNHPARQFWTRISRRELPQLLWEKLINVHDLDLDAGIRSAVDKYLKKEGLGEITDEVRWTRIFGGMNLQKFDYLNIGLINKQGVKTQFTDHLRKTDEKYLILRKFKL